MDEMTKKEGRTWADVERDINAVPEESSDLPPNGRVCGDVPPVPPAGSNGPERPLVHGAEELPESKVRPGPGARPPRTPVGRGRLTAYLLLTVALNALLAIYALYVLGIMMSSISNLLSAGQVESMPRLILLVVIMLSPLVLTILLNRLLYTAMRGRRRFPRGLWIFTVLLILIVQALTIYVIFFAGAAPVLETFDVQSYVTGGY